MGPVTDDRPRCPWAENHPLLLDYHDEAWGVPVRDDRALFAKLVLDGQEADRTFSEFLWSFVDGAPIVNRFTSPEQLPAETERSAAMAAALKERSFSFVAPTICYETRRIQADVEELTGKADPRAS